VYDPALLIPKKLDAAGAHDALAAAHDTLAQLEPWSEGQLEEALRALAEELELKPGQLFGALRVAITGRTVAPPLFETLAALGKQRALARIAAARDVLAST
jgi:glutamyl-tRNA synthetase